MRRQERGGMDTGRNTQSGGLPGGIGLSDLSDKVAVVTGSGRGLGKAMALGLAAAGAAVVTCSRTPEQAEQTAGEIIEAGGEAAATEVDTSDRKSCEQLIDFGVERFGKLDVFVNNAGIDIIKPAEEFGEHEWDEVVDINLKGYFNCAQLAGRRMLEQGAGGSIINNSSIASEVGIHGLLPYSAAKGGVNQLTRVMAVEWAQRGVRVNAVAPGYFENIMGGAAEEHNRAEKQEQVITFTPMARRGLPEELIGPIVFLASDASSYVTGAILYVDGGYSAM
jgi:NAD(P)-dependent dehydrogenase (short-subunit alcohol dehydrogenase family)